MGTLFNSVSEEASSTEGKTSEDPKESSEEILDSLINSGIPSSVGSINPPVLASYVEQFPDLVKHSINESKTNEIQKESKKTLSEEVTLDAKKPENSKENETAPTRKKAAKPKKLRGSQSPRRVTRTASKFHELSSPKQEIKDFFGSLNWYESNKIYYDKRLQLVLDDFESSETSDTGKGNQYYDYLLLDSRVSELTEWSGFIKAIFYVGKGKNQRALDHTKEAAKIWMMDGESTSKKVSRILDIWRGEGEVIVLTAADGLVEYEALTREALVIEALGKQQLCNKNYGSFYGVAAVLKTREKHELGATLLVKARERYLKNGAERVPPPVRLADRLKNMEEADRQRQFKNRDESSQPDKEIDNAVLTAVMTENHSEVQKTKRI